MRGFTECTFEWIHVIKDANPELLQILTMLMVEGKVTSWKTSDVQTDGRENDIVFLQNWTMFDPRKKTKPAPAIFLENFLIGIHEQNVFHIPGQISIIPKPEIRGFWGSSLIKPPFRVTSVGNVVIICPDIPCYPILGWLLVGGWTHHPWTTPKTRGGKFQKCFKPPPDDL